MYEPKEFLDKLLIVVDANEATIGLTNGEKIQILWHDISMVPRKHSKGGQSAQRFERGRREALKHWLRQVKEVALLYSKDRTLIIGGPGMTKESFQKELPKYLEVEELRHCGYTDENGLWEIMHKSRYI